MADILSTARMSFIGLLASQRTLSHLDFYSFDEHPLILGEDVTDAAYNFVWLPIRSLIHEDFTLLEIKGWYSDFTVGPQPTFTRLVNEKGFDVSGDALPPYCTVNVTKVPDQLTRTPITTKEFGLGFTGWAGISESAQDNGLLDGTYFTNWSAAAINYRELDVNEVSTPFVYTLGMNRNPPFPPDRAQVMTSSVNVKQVLGTRNSRKR